MDEPSEFALDISRRLAAGETFRLREEELLQLTEYEKSVLDKTALKLGYTVTLDEAAGKRTFSK